MRSTSPLRKSAVSCLALRAPRRDWRRSHGAASRATMLPAASRRVSSPLSSAYDTVPASAAWKTASCFDLASSQAIIVEASHQISSTTH